MAFWKKKEKDEGHKCPLCGTSVSLDDVTCPLCFYELKMSPRHQGLNITANEEDSLIGLLNSNIEEEDDEEILEVGDVLNLNAPEVTIEAKYDDDDLISVPIEHAPEFVTSRMTPQGVNEEVSEPDEMNNDEESDLGGIIIPNPPKQDEIEYEDIPSNPIQNNNEEQKVFTPPPLPELPTPPAPLELPTPPPLPELPTPPPPVEQNQSPYQTSTEISKISPSEVNKKVLNTGTIWPWNPKEEWDAKGLRSNLLEAMNAAKSGNNQKVSEILENIGPHLGKNINLIFHVGVLLKRIGREYELMQMLTKAQIQFPKNADVENALSKLT